jgi:hypothetical protein
VPENNTWHLCPREPIGDGFTAQPDSPLLPFMFSLAGANVLLFTTDSSIKKINLIKIIKTK